MNRFESETHVDSRYYARVFAEDAPAQQPQLTRCDGCRSELPLEELKATDFGLDAPIFCCASCKAVIDAQDEDLVCTCVQTDVDLFDARGCAEHDTHSRRNVARRSITAIQRYDESEVA